MEFLAIGLTLGVSAGFSPGPLSALAIAAGLEGGFRRGVVVALAPLLTDAPIIALAVAVSGRLPPTALSALGLVGGLVVLRLAWLSWHGAGRAASAGAAAPVRAVAPLRHAGPFALLGRAAAVNLLNPNPYVFWGTVGAPIIGRASARGGWQVAAFLAAFFAMLVGGKAALAGLAALGSGRLNEDARGRVDQALAVALGLTGLWLAARAVADLL